MSGDGTTSGRLSGFVRSWASPPHYDDAEESRVALIVHSVALAALGALLVSIIVRSITVVDVTTIGVGVEIALIAIALGLSRKRHTRVAAVFLSWSLVLTGTVMCVLDEGLRDITMLTFPPILLFAGLVLRPPSFWSLTALVVLSVSGMFVAERVGVMTPVTIRGISTNDAIDATMILLVTGIAIYLVTRNMQESIRKTQRLNEELEERVRTRTADLEQAIRDLESFSYSVSHDLRAPVRHVAGFADLAQTHLAPIADETGKRYLATIRQSADRMNNLIDALLAFSRLGRAELNTKPVSLAALVDEVRSELTHLLDGRKVTWNLTSMGEVQADPILFRQALANLLSNALKYSRGREEAVIAIRHDQDEASDRITVTDNGVGFDADYTHKLFGVFQRLHTEEEFEGTGIGLANVKRIVQKHGGSVSATSSAGEGAAFIIELPRIAQEPYRA